MIYFISGHRNITDEEFMLHYSPRIYDALRDPKAQFVIGECDGVDSLAQKFLIGKIDNDKVTIFHMGDNPKYYFGEWKLKGGYNTDIHRDSVMTNYSSVDIAWIRNWGENSGTEQNVLRRERLKE